MAKEKKILVTSALPYANGSIHVGHLVEYIQTDVFVRFLKLTGKKAIYCCADDTHGAPIEINARKQGIKPEQLIAKYFTEHQRDFKSFLIEFDNYYTTNSPENKKYSDLWSDISPLSTKQIASQSIVCGDLIQLLKGGR